MRELQFYDSGCEPARGRRAVVVAARRGLRALLRPTFVRLVEVLASIVSRLDRAEALVAVSLQKIDAGGARLDAAEARLDDSRRTAEALDRRTHGLAAHLAGLNEDHLALHADVQQLQKLPPRVDAAETRLTTAETEILAGKARLGRNDVLIDLGLQKIDAGGARLDAAETRLTTAERLAECLDTRTNGLAAHLAGLNDEHLALQGRVRTLHDLYPRVDSAEARLASFEWHVAVLHPKAEGLASHLEGLSHDHRALYTEVQSRIVQVTALSDSVANLGRRQDELEEKILAVNALHWDHVALARRLAAIEDLLVSRPAPADEPDARPSLPFPGLDGGGGDDEARSRVG